MFGPFDERWEGFRPFPVSLAGHEAEGVRGKPSGLAVRGDPLPSLVGGGGARAWAGGLGARAGSLGARAGGLGARGGGLGAWGGRLGLERSGREVGSHVPRVPLRGPLLQDPGDFDGVRASCWWRPIGWWYT